MSGNLLSPREPTPDGPSLHGPVEIRPDLGPPRYTATGPEEAGGLQLHRILGALKRYKWLILAVIMVGTTLGVLATRLLKSEYQTQATIWVASAPNTNGPVRGQEVLGTQGWADLARSFTVLDAVVQEQRLYIKAEVSQPFDSMAVVEPYPVGEYTLQVTPDKSRYTLLLGKDSVLESGRIGDSIGASLGMRWHPSSAMLQPGELKFRITSPRQAANELSQRLDVSLPPLGNFMGLTLRDESPARAASSLNSILDHFILAAVDLKAFKLRETSRILEEQLGTVGTDLRKAETRLETYKTQIITLPSEATSIAPGLQMTQPTVISKYFDEKIEVDRIQREREALRAAYSAAQAGNLNAAALQVMESVRNSPQLLAALQELTTAESDLRGLQAHYTDQAKQVQAAQEKVVNLRGKVVPEQLRLTLAALDARVAELQGHLAGASRELQSIPARMITEQRLERERQSLAGIYTDLQSRFQAARLAEATAIPDVKILDRAVRPTLPTTNAGPRLIVIAFLASLVAGLGLAILLDRLDRRVQYPEQISDALGLTILGAIPAIKRNRKGELAPDQAAQFIEAFRTVRVNLAHSFSQEGIRLTITSPSAGDGKSLVSSNLAVSFASAGYQTVLVDGDIRRGELHRMFGTDRRPGLLDYLQGEATLEQVVRPSNQAGLWIIPCGTRRQHGPELLGSAAMQRLLDELQLHYNAIFIDSPPLGAGVDPFVLGAATGSLLLVVRSGETDRHLAEAKLGLVDRLPIRVVGAVLNDVRATGAYRYYGYLYGYSSEEEEQPAQIGRVDGSGPG
jgi:capsular exopolysaccharide synthesis family protein